MYSDRLELAPIKCSSSITEKKNEMFEVILVYRKVPNCHLNPLLKPQTIADVFLGPE